MTAPQKPYITKHYGEVSGRYFWQVNYLDAKERGYKAHIFWSEAEARKKLAEALAEMRAA